MKISNLKTEKTSETIEREWTTALSIKHKLLRNSDWTQLLDSGLSLACRLRFEYWRLLVRRVTRSKFKTPEDAEAELTRLQGSMPTESQATRTTHLSSVPLCGSSITDFRQSVYHKLNEYWWGRNSHIIDQKYRQDEYAAIEVAKSEEEMIDIIAKVFDGY